MYTQTLPALDNYTKAPSPSFMLTFCDITVWFSYKTPVAFKIGAHDKVVRQNEWGTTTGKHLNAIDGGDKKARVSREEFERLWEEQTAPVRV